MAVKPKLALIPSAYKAGKVYSVLPSDGSGDFDNFSRSNQTATRVNKDGLIELVGSNIPRLNYPMIDGVVSGCPSLLLEPTRTNLITYSEDASQWINVNTTISQDDVISPDGTLNADKFEFTGNGSIRPNTSQLTFTNDYSFSIFIKKGNARYVTLAARFFTSPLAVGFDLDTETSQSGGIIENYGNDWYRLSLSNNVTGNADRTGVFYVYLPNSLGDESSVSGNNAYVWGAQVEESSFVTSYIPTNGEANGVTRSAETANGSGDANTFNDSEGVLMAEISKIDISQSLGSLFLMKDLNNSIRLNFSTSNRFNFFVKVGGFNQVDFDTYDYELEDYNKILVSYKLNEYSLWFNGYKIFTDTNATVSSGLNELKYNDFYGNTKQIQYFDTALTDTDLEELTSWTSFNEMAQAQLYTIQ